VQEFTGADFVREVLAAGPTKGSAIIDAGATGVHVDISPAQRNTTCA